MRTRLGLTDKELLDKTWIALNLELLDYPWYDYSENKEIEEPGTIEEQRASIGKLIKRTSQCLR